MSAKFTSGTWTASPEEGTTEWRVDAGTWGIAICADFPGDGEVEANARLIAAAPDLLYALEEALHLIETLTPLEGSTVRIVRAAIAKATGEQR